MNARFDPALYPDHDDDDLTPDERLVHDYVVYQRNVLVFMGKRADRDGVTVDLTEQITWSNARWHALLICYNIEVRAAADETDRDCARAFLQTALPEARIYAKRRITLLERDREVMLKRAEEDSEWGEFVKHADLALSVLRDKCEYMSLEWRDRVDVRFACHQAQRRHLRAYGKGEVDEL
jgi:hypothetical protein